MSSSAPSSQGCEPSPKGVWRVGTLVYSRPALVFLFLWLLLGDFAWSMRDRSVGAMASWYVSQLGISNLGFALLTGSIPALFGIVLGPIVSVMSDRHRGPRGRRIPFLLYTTPIAAAGMIGLGLTPVFKNVLSVSFPGINETLLALFCFSISWTVFEFATIISMSVFGGLINDVVPPQLIGRFHGLFRAVSLVDGMIFNYWLMGRTPDYYTLILVCLGLFYGIAFMLVCLKIKEGNYPDSEPSRFSVRRPSDIRIAIKNYLRECFGHPYYTLVCVMLTLGTISFLPVNAFSIRYALHLNLSMEDYGHVLATTYFISLLLAVPLGWLSDVCHPIRTAMSALGFYVLAMAWSFLYGDTKDSFSFALLFHGVCSGAYFTCAASLGNRLFPRSRFAQFASAASILGSVTGIILPMLIGSAIDWGDSYRLIFVFGAIISSIALVITLLVYQKFLAYGGSSSYTAPQVGPTCR